MTNRILFILLAGLFAGSLSADPIAVVKLEPYRNTIAMHANVGGRDGFFVFDTGAGIAVINPQFAEKFCTPWGRNTGFAMMGNRMESPRCDDVAVCSQITDSERIRVRFARTSSPWSSHTVAAGLREPGGMRDVRARGRT